MDARIWLTGAGGEPRSLALSGERTIVGRSPEADLHLDDEAVSWNHLEIERRGEVLIATDLDSSNGTVVNGEPLERPRRLRDGDTLIVGGHRLEVSLGAATAGGETPTVKTTVTDVPSRTERPPAGMGKSRAESILPERTVGPVAATPPCPLPPRPAPVPSPAPPAPVPAPWSRAPEEFSLPVEDARGAGVLRGRGTGGAVTSRGVARRPSSAAAPSSTSAVSGLGSTSGGGGV